MATSSGRIVRLIEEVPACEGQPAGWLVLVEGETAPEWRSLEELTRHYAASDNPVHHAVAVMLWANQAAGKVRS